MNKSYFYALQPLWRSALLKGLLLIVLGLCLLLKPWFTLKILLILVGAYWLIDGLSLLLVSFKLDHRIKLEQTDRNLQSMLKVRSILGIIGGLLLLTMPLLVAATASIVVFYLLGFFALINGFTDAMAYIALSRQNSRDPSLLVSAALSIVFALVLLFAPIGFSRFISIVLGLVALAFGLQLVYLSYVKRES